MLSKLRSTLVCTIALFVSASAHAQNTIHVPADQPTIQAGINAANTGDTVLVAPGTYYENIDFKGKAITVTSSGGAASTIIDGGAAPGLATVAFQTNETRASVISNFTIRNGGPATFNSQIGGGIYVYNSAPTILNNTITANQCDGIDSYYGAALAQGNNISGTTFAEAYCSFEPVGIVLYGNYLNGTLNNSIIGNIIENNTSTLGGPSAAIFVWVSNGSVIVGNIIRNNFTSGGVVQMANSESIIFSQNLVYGNYSPQVYSGEALGLSLGIPDGAPPFYGVIVNNTFANNTVTNGSDSDGASQVFISGDVSKFYFANNILSGTGALPLLVCNDEYAYLSPGPMLVENNDAFNPSGPTYDSSCANGAGMAGNITADPLFKNPANNDFHLQSGSPAIDVGTNNALSMLMPYGINLTTDLDGNPRIQDATGKGCIIDMGVYEYPGTVTECSTTETLTSSLNPSTYGQSVTFTAQLSSANGVPTGEVQFSDGNTVLGAEVVSSTGASTYTTSLLTVGTHNITAAYQPSGVFPAATASLSQVVTGYATSTTLTCSATPIYVDATTLLSAMVTSSNGTPTGSITFTDASTTLGQIPLTNGDASLSFTPQSAGAQTITATYVPTGDFAASSATCALSVLALPTISVLTVNPLNSTYGSPVTLTATVSPVTKPGPSIPTGTVTFYNGATSLNTATLSSGVATYTTSTLPGGPDNLTCAYSGSSIYAPSSCNTVTTTIAAAPTTLTLASSANPSPALTPITFTAQLTVNGQPAPAGNTITLTLNGQTVTLTTNATGVAAYTTTGLIPNTYPVTATFAGTTDLQPSSASLLEQVNPNPTTTTLTASPTPGQQAQPVTLSATVTATLGAAAPDGSVKFFDASTLLGTTSVTPATSTTSTATLTTSTLAAGSHSLSAIYVPGTTSFLPSQSTLLPYTVLLEQFTITAAQNPLYIVTTHTGTDVLTLTSLGGFTAAITISCPPAVPPAVTCTLSSTTVQLPANGTATTTLTLNTEITTGSTFWTRLDRRHSTASRVALASIVPLALLSLAGLRRRRFNLLNTALTLAILAVLASTLTACGPGQTVSTYPGTYPLTFAATGTPQGSSNPTTHALNLTLVVTPDTQ